MTKPNTRPQRLDPETERDLIRLAGELTIMDGKIHRMPDITKRIREVPSWRKVLDEVKKKKEDFNFDLRK